jgi:hypothetical protein
VWDEFAVAACALAGSAAVWTLNRMDLRDTLALALFEP